MKVETGPQEDTHRRSGEASPLKEVELGCCGVRRWGMDERSSIIAQLLRRDFLVPVNLMFTHDVPDLARAAALQGVRDAFIAAGAQDRELFVFDGDHAATDPHGSADWYVQKTEELQLQLCPPVERDLGWGPQVFTGLSACLLMRDPFQFERPHWDVLVVNRDLWDGHTADFEFGVTNSEFPYSIQSVTRFLRDIDDSEVQAAAVRRALRHEVGHMLGLSTARGYDLEERLDAHCSCSGCSMRQGASVEEWSAQALEEDSIVAGGNGSYFCDACMGDLEARWGSARPAIPREDWDSIRLVG